MRLKWNLSPFKRLKPATDLVIFHRFFVTVRLDRTEICGVQTVTLHRGLEYLSELDFHRDGALCVVIKPRCVGIFLQKFSVIVSVKVIAYKVKRVFGFAQNG